MFNRNLAVSGIKKGNPIHVMHASKSRRVRKPGPLDQASLFLGLPEELTQDRNFLLYRVFDSETPGGKPGKVPVSPKTGFALNGWQNPKNWMTYEEAYRHYVSSPGSFDGLGYALCGNGITCVDIDAARDDSGELTPRAKKLVDLIPGWVEISTSGNLHIWTRSQWPERKTTDHTNKIEVFYGSGFIALTGNSLDVSRAIPQQNVDLQSLLAPYLQVASRPQGNLKPPDPFEQYCKRDANLTLAEARRIVMEELKPAPQREDWRNIGMALHFQFEGDLGALEVWDEFSAREGCGEYLGFEDLRKQWDSFTLNHPNPITFASIREKLKKKVTRESALRENPFVRLNLEEHKAIDFLLKGIIDQGITLFCGASNAGKTTMMIDLLSVVAHLCPVDHFLRMKGRRKVIYLTEDVGQIERIFRGKRTFGGMTASAEEINSWIKVISGKKFDHQELIQLIVALAEQESVTVATKRGSRVLPPLFVIDTASSNLKIEDENKNSEVSDYIAALKEAISISGASVWIIAHTPKASNRTDVTELTARGAGAWGDNVQTVVGIKREAGSNQTILAVRKNRISTQFDELEYTTTVHSLVVEDDYGDEQTLSYVIGELRPSTTADRLANKAKRQQEQQAVAKAEHERELADLIMAHVRDFPHQNRESLRHSVGGSNQTRDRIIGELIRDGYLISRNATADERKACNKKVLLKLTSKKYPMNDFDV